MIRGAGWCSSLVFSPPSSSEELSDDDDSQRDVRAWSASFCTTSNGWPFFRWSGPAMGSEPTSRLGPAKSSPTASVAAEMRGRDALGPARAGKAQHRSEGGSGQVVGPAVVLGASPACPDGHHLEADEAPLLPVEASRTQELHLQAALLAAGLVHVLKATDRPVSLLHGSGPAFQAKGDHVTVNRRHAAGQCRVLDRARRKRRGLSAYVVEEMEPGESLDEGPRHLARPAGLRSCRPGTARLHPW